MTSDQSLIRKLSKVYCPYVAHEKFNNQYFNPFSYFISHSTKNTQKKFLLQYEFININNDISEIVLVGVKLVVPFKYLFLVGMSRCYLHQYRCWSSIIFLSTIWIKFTFFWDTNRTLGYGYLMVYLFSISFGFYMIRELSYVSKIARLSI